MPQSYEQGPAYSTSRESTTFRDVDYEVALYKFHDSGLTDNISQCTIPR